MVNDAKQVAMDPRNQSNANAWRNSNGQLLAAVGGIRQAIAPDRGPDMSSLVISGTFVRRLFLLFFCHCRLLPIRRLMSLSCIVVVVAVATLCQRVGVYTIAEGSQAKKAVCCGEGFGRDV